ncbi:hypothetical protein BWQ96_00011 [Gracilariopsis chorda]|uniref:Uncharacterized protein n=1 Tax=Gracilariopsis chorda TaxID=448386 RepID=A0A2V3J600_9FLOR|nr:hypothetical protein BWQ96_00011 [Gracilariopsis chorda]|eukprot:PXF49851.1 hypothetical protein BWQ96_00011 [Gracilariopsis chorda]
MTFSRTSKQLWFVLLVIIISECIRKKSLSAIRDQSKRASYKESIHSFNKFAAEGHNRETRGSELNGSLSIFQVCLCRSQNNLSTNASIHTIVNAKGGTITRIDVQNSSSVDFFDPPIPIIGTDDANTRDIYASDVAEFATHVKIWREVFHMKHSCALVISCEVNNVDEVLNRLLGEKLCDIMQRDNGIERKPKAWEMLVFGAKRVHRHQDYEALGSTKEIDQVLSGDMLVYALNKRGADLLLSYTKAYTVPLEAFLHAVITRKKQFRVGRLNAARAMLGHECTRSGHAMKSNLLPFYPPLYWTYLASKQESLKRSASKPLAVTHSAPLIR